MATQETQNASAVRAAVLALCLLMVISRSASLATSETFNTKSIVPLVTRELFERNITVCEDSLCHNRSQRNKPSSKDALDRNCYCDETCGMFGDCCLDSLAVNSPPREDISCLRLRNYLGVYVVSRCPDEWPQDGTRQRCETPSVPANDPLLGLPVTSPHTRMTYRTAACARCHTDTRDAVLWSPRVECPGIRPGHEGRDLMSTLKRSDDGGWSVTVVEDSKESSYQCTLSLDMPQKLQDIVRACVPAVSHCEDDEIVSSIAALCERYTAFVYDSGRSSEGAKEVGHVYKNPHCALANGVAPENITCNWNSMVEEPEEAIYSASSLVLNITNSKGDNDGNSTYICSDNRVWDPFLYKCRDLFSNVAHSMVGEVRTPSTSLNSWYASSGSANVSNDVKKRFQLMPCTKFVIYTNEFQKMDDGSVYVDIYYRQYSVDEYEYVGNNIAVCSEMIGFTNSSDPFSIIAMVFVSASIVCLCCHLVVFSLLPKLRNLPGKNLACFCVTLLVAYACYLAKPFPKIGSRGCNVLAITMYTSCVASLLWTNVMAFDVFTTLR